MRVYVGMGSNQGDRQEHLEQALVALDSHPEIQVLSCSRIYETEYVGPGHQDPYLNAGLQLETDLAPLDLLDVLKECETLRGRTPEGHMLPRPLDLDILLIRGRVVKDHRLQVPHPRARQRAFVMEPLCEIGPDEVFPDSGETVSAICAKIRQKSGVTLRAAGELHLPSEGSSASKEDWRAALAVYRR